MYQVHDWSKVRELVREGVPKKRIAEQLGCSRTTVYRLAGLAEPPCYERRSAGSQLEPFKDAIADMLIEDEAAPATVIRERLHKRGYAGGITILKDYLREVRPLYRRRDYQRTVYAPGEILQADWWDTGLDLSVGKGASRRAYGFVTTLPFSAAHSVVFTHSQTTADALPALLGCLARLGGVPERLVMDRDSSLVARTPRRRARPVDELAALLGALSMGHIILPPISPEAKGSVERTNGYLETSFLPLRRFSGLADLQGQHDAWAEGVAWPRHLRRLGGRVAEALADERAVTAAAFLERALAFFAGHGIEARRPIADNGACYRSQRFAAAAAAQGLKLSHTRPYRPQTNGKAEAFVKIVQNGWAYKRPYDSTAERIAALPGFLRYYNGYRPHGGLDGDTPLGRLRSTTS